MREHHGLSGWLSIEARDPSGALIWRRRHQNLITAAGRDALARYFAGLYSGAPTLSIHIGTGESAPTPDDTGLAGETASAVATGPTVVPRSEPAGPGDDPTTMPRAVATVTASFAALAAGQPDQALREAGLFLEIPGAGEVLYSRVVFMPVTRTANLDLTLTWEVLF